MALSNEIRERILYAAGHLIASEKYPEDPHAGDSADLAWDVFEEIFGHHRCDTGHFDRTICPEPCGVMHSYCATCGRRQDRCAHEGEL